MHAYLIIAHNNFSILEKLLKLLDDARNDIYIHIDKKAQFKNYDKLKLLCKYSNVLFIESMDIKWADFTQVECELNLLKIAVEKKYEYIHLLSGVCMPIKTQDEIHKFFNENRGKEFIYFETAYPTGKTLERVRYYHYFSGRRNIFNRIMTKAEVVVQKALGINRIKGKKIQKGANWFSITGDFAKYVVAYDKDIRKQFHNTISGDEFFLQTIFINSPFKDNLYKATFDDSNEQNMRYIDWKRGNPYTFNEADFDEIMNSGCLFVRKLTEDNKLPDMIFSKIFK